MPVKIDSKGLKGNKSGKFMIKTIIGLFLGLLVITVCVSAATVSPMIPLYDCQVINITGHYVLQNNVNNSRECFIIYANNTVLDLNGYNVTGENTEEGVTSWGTNNVAIRNGFISNFSKGIWVHRSRSNLVEDNIIDYSDGDGISVAEGSNNIIRRNRVTNSYSNGLSMRDTFSNTVTNNILKNNRRYDFEVTPGLNASLGCNNTITNNRGTNGYPIIFMNDASLISNVKLSELVLCNADNSRINRVTINNSGFNNNGILLLQTDNTILKDVVSINSFVGIYMQYSNNNTVIHSTFNDNLRTGMALWESNWNKLISSLINNNDLAVELDNSRNNTLHTNHIVGNYDGIEMEDDDDLGGNLFYNNFFNNTWNIGDIDGYGFNAWNTTLTPGINIVGGPFIGGNFWANYSGTGFSQICADLNNDRICDQSYLLENYYINNTDYLALR